MSKPHTERADHLPPERANEPGRYACTHCGEALSGPAGLYRCPYARVPVENLGRDA